MRLKADMIRLIVHICTCLSCSMEIAFVLDKPEFLKLTSVSVTLCLLYHGMLGCSLRPRELIFNQFSIGCCQNAFASGAPPRTPLGGLQRPPQTPSCTRLGTSHLHPPPFSHSWIRHCIVWKVEQTLYKR